MTQKERLELLTGEKMPDPTPQEYKRIQLENTPFWIIGSDEKGYNIILGHWKINQEPLNFTKDLHTNDPLPLTNYEIQIKANDWLEKNKWNTFLSMIIAISTDQKNN